jgi:hypothetical protein
VVNVAAYKEQSEKMTEQRIRTEKMEEGGDEGREEVTKGIWSRI